MKQRIHKSIRVALGATFLFATMLMVGPLRAATCKDVNIIFMRGSSQNYVPHNGEDVNFPNYTINPDNKLEFNDYRYDKTNDKEPAFVTFEKESLKYFKSLGDRIRLEYPTLSYQFVSVHDFAGKYNTNGYRAVPAFGSAPLYVSRNALDARLGESALINESAYGDYRQSVADGAEELAGYLQDEMNRCPSQLPIVGGFSQGAHVVGEAVKLLHDRGQDKLLSRLGHVDMYGDPKFNGYEQTTNRLNPLKKHVTMPWARGSANRILAGSLGPRKPYVPDILFNKTTSWCDALDVVCGGMGALNVFAATTHGEIYSKDTGYIEQSANEIYVDVKKRLSLLAGVADKSANSPLAYWNVIKKPKKLDIVFVMDRTGDENISLQPDPDYIIRNLNYLAKDAGYSSFHVGVVTYTEFSRYNGQKDIIESVVRTPVTLTPDIFGTYSYFTTEWGKAHFQNPPSGGDDLQDSPHSALNTALDMNFNADARKVIVLFSNTYGKDSEDTTNLTTKQITTKAKKKGVEILPVFTSKTYRAHPDNVQKVPAANAYWHALSKATSGHYTEITDGITERLLYDVIMGHVYAPDVEISLGKTYNAPKAPTATKKTSAPSTIKNTKPAVKAKKKTVLTAAKTTSAKSKIKTYAWDLNGDGVPDVTSTTPEIEHVFEDPYNGTISVDVTDEEGNTSTGHQDIEVTEDDNAVTHEEPEDLPAPNITAVRSGNTVVLTWPPTTGEMVVSGAEGEIIAVTSASNGTITLLNAPPEAFSVYVQVVDGNDSSIEVEVTIPAMEVPETPKEDPVQEAETVVPETGPNTGSGNGSGGANTGAYTGTDPIPASSMLQNSTSPAVLGAVTALRAAPTSPTPNITKVTGVTHTINTPITPEQSLLLKTKLRDFLQYFRGQSFKLNVSFYGGLFLKSIPVLLILLLLLLILLYVLVRDRHERAYMHSKKYQYPIRHVRSGTYKTI